MEKRLSMKVWRVHELAAHFGKDPQEFLKWLRIKGFLDSNARSISAHVDTDFIETIETVLRNDATAKSRPKPTKGIPVPTGVVRGPASRKDILGSGQPKGHFVPAPDWLGKPKKGQSLRSPNREPGEEP